MSFIKYIADENHYKEVLSLVGKAKQTVWTVADVSIVQTPLNSTSFLYGLLRPLDSILPYRMEGHVGMD